MKAKLQDAIMVSVAFASAETFLVQWTSRAVSLPLLAFGFWATFVFFLALAGGTGLLRAVSVRIRSRPILHDSMSPLVLCCLIVYTVARMRAAGVLPIGLPVLSVALIVVVGWLGAFGTPFLGSSRWSVKRSWLVPILYISSILWLTRAHLEAERTVICLILFTLAAGLNIGVGRLTLGRAGNSAQRLGFGAALILIGLNAGIVTATYPAVPGVNEPSTPTLPSAVPAPGIDQATNIVLIVLDTVRADRTSLHGYSVPTTPNLEILADQATVFSRAYANSTFSLPSHASLLTGLLPHEHGANYGITESSQLTEPRGAPLTLGAVPLSKDIVTIPEYARLTGLRTGLIAANHGYLSAAFGLQQGFEYADARPQTQTALEFVVAPFLRNLPVLSIPQRYAWISQRTVSAPRIIDRALTWLDGRENEPFFLMLNFMDAHEPLGTAYAALRIEDIQRDFDPTTDTCSFALCYDIAVRYLDHSLEALFDGLRARGLFDTSLIIITSDHGEDFREDLQSRHGRLPFENQIHVPLLIKAPKQKSGNRIETPVQGVDILPTILATLRGEVPEGLAGAVAGAGDVAIAEVYFARHSTDPVHLDNVHAVRPTAWALVESVWKLTVQSDGTRRLSRPVDDPTEARNLKEDYPAIAARMEERLRSLVPPEAFTSYLFPDSEHTLDDETLERLRSLGYVR